MLKFTLKQRIENSAKLITSFNFVPPIFGLFEEGGISVLDTYVNSYSHYGEAYIPGAVLIRLNSGGYHIAVNNAFSDLPESLKSTVIAHELGHYHYGHTAPLNPDHCTKNELEADRYAIMKGHDIFHLLTVLANFIPILVLNSEFNERLNQALNMQAYVHKKDIANLKQIKMHAKVIHALGRTGLINLFK